MPIYDMLCPSCHKKDVDVLLKNREEFHKCTRCGADMKPLFPTSVNAHVWPQDGIFLEHVCPEGKRFYSKKEMKEYAKKNNLEIAMLED